MFTAAVAICALVNGAPDLENCSFFGDAYGPYETQAECDRRSTEMRLFLTSSEVVLNSLRQIHGENMTSLGYCYVEEPPGELL